jgi:chromosome segregation ATPase
VTAHHNSTDQNSRQILEAIDKQTQHLESCSLSLEGLHLKADSTNNQEQTLQSYHAEVQEIGPRLLEIRDQSSTIQETTQETSQHLLVVTQQNSSLLSSMTRLLFMITSGMLTLHSLRKKVTDLVQLWSTFTAEMRNFSKQTLQVKSKNSLLLTNRYFCRQIFAQINESLSRIEGNLPKRAKSILLPSVFFQDAWGNTMHVPLQICQSFKVSLSSALKKT